MRTRRNFQPRLESMPIRITPSDLLDPMAPVVMPYGPTDPAPTTDPMAPVIMPYCVSSPYTYADT
jgi:hypothetical protein